MPIVLIGLRGSGKTSIGRALAERLGRPFIDTDDWVVSAAGKSIREIFKQEGEAGFRRREREAVAAALRAANAVIAVGGGAVMDAQNQAALQSAFPRIWLRASADELLRRLSNDPASPSMRPALTALEARAEIESLLAERGSIYASLADLMIDTDGLSIEQVVGRIVDELARLLRSAETREMP